MFPIRDHNPSERVPFVTYALVVMNALVFLYMWPLYGTIAASQIFVDYGLIPNRLSYGFAPETLITSMFVHGGFMHFAGNMLFLWIFGDNLEDMLAMSGSCCFIWPPGSPQHFCNMPRTPAVRFR